MSKLAGTAKAFVLLLAFLGYGLLYWGGGMVNHSRPQPLMYVLFKFGPSNYQQLG